MGADYDIIMTNNGLLPTRWDSIRNGGELNCPLEALV